MNWLADARDIVVALLLVGLNGFFVAAEFALVKVRGSQLDVLGGNGSLASRVASWLGKRLDADVAMEILILVAYLLGTRFSLGEHAFWWGDRSWVDDHSEFEIVDHAGDKIE